jgi:UDPglucose--hexose-1-phosphate uridylyltransferase
MSEMRQDLTTGEWVIIAKDRGSRPHDFTRAHPRPAMPVYSPSCPFCAGNEAMTPPEVLRYRDAETSNWQVRVFPNEFPALAPGGSTTSRREEGIYLRMDGVGIHEVIVETPLHNQPLALMDDKDVERVLTAYRERFNTLREEASVRSITIFKNHGPSAGTSLMHSHSQLLAAPVVPERWRRMRTTALDYYDRTGRSLYTDIREHEQNEGARIVLKNEKYVVLQPFASRRAFETWIMPITPHASFGDIPAEDLPYLAHALKVTLCTLHRGLNDPDYNYIIETAPPGEEDDRFFLWHMRIVPRLNTMAGFEIGTGICINPALPEETARFLKGTGHR